MKPDSRADQVLGCILGGAIGDAVGGVPERGRLCLSDDTQLTLATCEALLASSPPSPGVVAEAFLRWFRAGALTGLGSSTLKALRDLAAGAHWALAGAGGEMSAGNGAAMRAAPLAFALNPDDPADRVVFRDICRITHRNDEAYVGALAVVSAIRAGAPLSLGRLAGIAAELPDTRVRDRLLEISRLPEETSLAAVAEHFGASGFVAETVPLALLAAGSMTSGSFEAVLEDLVKIGGDTDTIAAIAGQVAGAHLGYARLPEPLRSLLPIQEVFAQAQAFSIAFGVA